MQMRGDGISGVADEAENLAAFYGVAGMDANFSGLEMGVNGVAMIAEFEDYGIAVGLLDGNIFRIFSRSLFGEAVGDGGDGGIGDGDGFLAEDGVAGEIFAGPVVDAIGVVELFPVDGVALGDPDASVDGERGASVAGGVAAGVGGDVVCAAEGRADDGDRLRVDGDLAAGFGDFVLAGRRGFGVDSAALGEMGGRGLAGRHGHVDEEQG